MIGIWRGAVIVCCAAIVSCSGAGSSYPRLPTVPVEGTITYRGKPAVGAMIMLYPVDPKLIAYPQATADALGKFTITTYHPPVTGAPPATYKVCIVVPEKPPERDTDEIVDRLAGAYNVVKTTPLSIEVPSGGKTDWFIPLR